MIRIQVNGAPREIEGPTPLPILVAQVTGTEERRGYAVARNGTVVPKSRWDDVQVEAGDDIEIAAPMQGG